MRMLKVVFLPKVELENILNNDHNDSPLTYFTPSSSLSLFLADSLPLTFSAPSYS